MCVCMYTCKLELVNLLKLMKTLVKTHSEKQGQKKKMSDKINHLSVCNVNYALFSTVVKTANEIPKPLLWELKYTLC